VARATARNAAHVAAGRLEVVHADLASFRREPVFDTVFAVDVNVFWTTAAEAECRALGDLLAPGGVIHLVYADPDRSGAGRDVAGRVAAHLRSHGFDAGVRPGPAPSLVAVTAHRGVPGP